MVVIQLHGQLLIREVLIVLQRRAVAGEILLTYLVMDLRGGALALLPDARVDLSEGVSEVSGELTLVGCDHWRWVQHGLSRLVLAAHLAVDRIVRALLLALAGLRDLLREHLVRLRGHRAGLQGGVQLLLRVGCGPEAEGRDTERRDDARVVAPVAVALGLQVHEPGRGVALQLHRAVLDLGQAQLAVGQELTQLRLRLDLDPVQLLILVGALRVDLRLRLLFQPVAVCLVHFLLPLIRAATDRLQPHFWVGVHRRTSGVGIETVQFLLPHLLDYRRLHAAP